MKVSYDHLIPLGGISVSPWARLGPHLWFDDYRIASYHGWDISLDGAPEVKSLMGYKPQALKRLNTQHLLNNPDFQQILKKDFSNRTLLTYKPTSIIIPPALLDAGIRFLKPRAAKNYENKLLFRQRFEKELPFPEFTIITPEAEPSLQQLLNNKEAVVLQDEWLSGGKGTFIIRDNDDLEAALRTFRKTRRHIIASRFIENARERSLQGCVTRFGTFIGPLQKQLVRREELANPLNADKFCGAEISPDDTLYGVYDEMKRYCQIVGEELRNQGYRGIFGVDFLISPQGQVFVLEVNQRITGVTPLLSMLYRQEQDIPFYLLHILEQGNFDYTFAGTEVNTRPLAGSLLICHSLKTKTTKVERIAKSGHYDPKNWEYKSQGFWPEQDSDEILLQRQISPGTEVKAGAKLVTAFIPSGVLNRQDNFTDTATEIIENVYKEVRLTYID